MAGGALFNIFVSTSYSSIAAATALAFSAVAGALGLQVVVPSMQVWSCICWRLHAR